MENITPMMQQYIELKNQYQDCILFFRLGDFYEMFFEDALLASKELEITLTGRDCGQKERAPMCGVPHHAAESYVSKLIDKGYKVAICEQIEDPSMAKGIVKRDVVKIITPGTLIDAHMLKEKENNYIMSVYFCEEKAGVTFADISTGELRTTELAGDKYIDKLIDEIVKINPAEIIINTLETNKIDLQSLINSSVQSFITLFDQWAYKKSYCIKIISNHFQVITLDGFGLEEHEYSICSTGALLEYLNRTQKSSLSHMTRLEYYTTDQFMILDKSTRKNLELTETIRDKKRKGSLLWLLDKTNTAMGARILKKWIEEPLLHIDEIQMRLDVVEELKNIVLTKEELKTYLKQVYDLERLIGRISYGNANARDLAALKNSLNVMPEIKNLLGSLKTKKIVEIYNQIDPVEEVIQLITASIEDDPPIAVKEGGIIKKAYNHDLDELREIILNGKTWIVNLEDQERKATGIKSLKIGFNKVFGYYLEVTKSNYNLVPDYYIRKQTLANSERYITPDLKEVESKLLGAEDKVIELEYTLFQEIREKIKTFTKRIQKTAMAVAALDALVSFADVSEQYKYCKPIINQGGVMNIKNGRHPVVERMMNANMFINNDTLLDKSDNRFSIITGPNMAGKSTYMRQSALIVLMAQIGCFVPADEAVIGVVDRIFTRVGASDDLAQGHSTFMVEMSELANILNNATAESLIILDEIGRGTSTYDGLSIAWAVVEYISSKDFVGARTMFATHYHELTELEGILQGVKNYSITVKESGEDIIFLRKIVRGRADQSYGIQVARLAGIPNLITDRAKELLKQLEEHDINNKKRRKASIEPTNFSNKEKQLSLFNFQHEFIVSELAKINILKMTPMEAMNTLYKLNQLAKGDENEKKNPKIR